MRISGWIIFMLAAGLFAGVVAFPAVMAAIELVRGESVGVVPFSPGLLFLKTGGWSLGIAIGAIGLGWWPARVLAALVNRRAFIPVAALCVLPIFLPPYVLFWAWWSAWPADSWLYRLAVEHHAVDLARQATLALGLLCWAWPMAALILAAAFASSSRHIDELLALDGAGPVTRFVVTGRASAGALAVAAIVVFLTVFSNTTCFDLAQVKTLGYELRAIEADGASPREVLVVGMPGIAAAMVCIGGVAVLLRRRSRDSVEGGSASIPIARIIGSAMVMVLSVGVPLAILASRRVDWQAAADIATGYTRAAVHTSLAALTAGAIATFIALGLANTWANGGRMARVAATGQAIGWFLAAAIPAMVVWVGIESAFNRSWGPLHLDEIIYRQPAIVVLGYLLRFGFVAVLMGAWLAFTEGNERRWLRQIDGATGLFGFIAANRPRVVAALIATMTLVTVLSMGEIALSSKLQPPAFEGIGPILLSNMHYQRDEMVVLMSLLLFGLAALSVIVIGGLWWMTTGRRGGRGRAVAAIALAITTGLILVGCGDEDRLAGDPLQPVLVFGSAGRSPGQFVYPRAIDVDPQREIIYVVDRSGRVQRFDFDGEPQGRWFMPAYDSGFATGITVAPDGRVFVADTHEHRVTIFDRDGHLLDQFGEYGQEPGQFIFPTDIAFGPDGRIYVSEYGGNDRIQVFDDRGGPLFSFGAFGSEDGRFNRPQSISFSRDLSELYVADACNHRIQVFDPDGRWLRSFGSVGTNPGQFRYPYGVKLLDDRSVLVSEFGNGRLQVMSPTGDPRVVLGRRGEGPGELLAPWSAAATDDRLFVLDSRNSRVQVIRYP